MYNQAQGVYPQLAGSFTNVPGMSPHDNGRAAMQVPTMGPMQSYFNAGDVLAGQGNIPFGQSHLRSHADATSARLGVYGALGTIGVPALASYGLGLLGTGPALLASAAALPSVFEYAKTRNRTREMQQMVSGVHLAASMRDMATGGIHKGAAYDLHSSLSGAARHLGGSTKDLLSTTQMAGQMGMLSGHGQSVSALTRRVMDLAKASRDIISLGEGISLSDAMQLQQITEDIGISNAKFRGMGIGKTLLAGAKIANMTLQEATQAGFTGAQMYSQLGFSAAAGVQAGIQSSVGAATMVNNGVFSSAQLARLGGQAGLQQNLLATGAMSLAGISENLISGAVRFNSEGGAYIDRNLLDRYMRGEVTAEEMQKRGERIRRLPGRDQSLIRTQIRRAMPDLMESISEQYGPNTQMAIAAREIINLRNSRRMNIYDAASQYFGGDQAKVETFMGYVRNFPDMMDEQRREGYQQFSEQMASARNLGVNRAGVAYTISSAASDVYDFFATPGRLFGQYMDRKEASARNEALGIMGDGSAIISTGPRRFRARDVSLGDIEGGGDYVAGPRSILDAAISRLRSGRQGALTNVFGDIEASKGSALVFSDDAGLQALQRVRGEDAGDLGGVFTRFGVDENDAGLRQAGAVALERYRDIQAPMAMGMPSSSMFSVGRRAGGDPRELSASLAQATTTLAQRFRAVTNAGSNVLGITYNMGDTMNLSTEQMRQVVLDSLPTNVRNRLRNKPRVLDSMVRDIIGQLKRDGDDSVRGGIARMESNDRALASLVQLNDDAEGSADFNVIEEMGIDRESIRALHAAGMSGEDVAKFLTHYGNIALGRSRVFIRGAGEGEIGSTHRADSGGVLFGDLDRQIRENYNMDPDSAAGRQMKAILERIQVRSRDGFGMDKGTYNRLVNGREKLLNNPQALGRMLDATLRGEKREEYLNRLQNLAGAGRISEYLTQFSSGGIGGVRFRADNVRELVGQEFYDRYVGNNMEVLGELQGALEGARGGNSDARTNLLRVIKRVADRAQEGAGGGRGGSGGVTTAVALSKVSEALDAFKATMTELATKARGSDGEGAITIRIVGS